MALMTHGSVHTQYEARLLLLDDDTLFREAIAAMFGVTQDMSVVASTDCPRTAFTMLGRCHPNVAIINARLPKRIAFRWTRMAQESAPNLGVIFLDQNATAARVAEALSIGVAGYFTRRSLFHQLARGVALVARGGSAFGDDVNEHLVTTHRGTMVPPADDEPSLTQLTPRESEVFELLAQGFSVRQCADQLQLAQSTVDNHKSRLMKKLDLHKSSGLTRLAIREGLIMA